MKIKYTYYYRRIDGDDVLYKFETDKCYYVDTSWGREMLIEDCVKDFYYKNDGWELSWPQIFEIVHDDETVSRYEISMEMEPVFYAYEADDID